MTGQWINRSGARELLIFFNGWGMDPRPFSGLNATGLDVLMFYDYSTLDLPCGLDLLFQNYTACHLVAWSLGVPAAAAALGNCRGRLAGTVAVNGTLCPIDAEYGIAPEIFQGTLESWNAGARNKFYRRMCVSAEIITAFSALAPARDAEAQKLELAAIQQRTLQSTGPLPNDFFDRAVIGCDDRIFPVAAQKKCWSAAGVTFKSIPAPHYPFAGLRYWKELPDIGQH